MELTAHNQLLRVDLERGAAISHLTLIGQNGQSKSIIEPNEEFKFESSLLFPFPNRLAGGKFSFQGKTYQFPHNDFGQPNALHGIIHDMTFGCVEESTSTLVLELKYKGDIPYYPFPFKLEVKYILGQGSLDIEIDIENSGSESMPCGFGWHPYFNLGNEFDDSLLKMGDMIKVEVDELSIPTGKETPYHTFDQPNSFSYITLDNCFIYPSDLRERSTELIYKDKSVLEVWQDNQQSFVQVFTHPNKKAIAIEPMTCGINAFNTGKGLRVLKGGESWKLRMGLRYK